MAPWVRFRLAYDTRPRSNLEHGSGRILTSSSRPPPDNKHDLFSTQHSAHSSLYTFDFEFDYPPPVTARAVFTLYERLLVPSPHERLRARIGQVWHPKAGVAKVPNRRGILEAPVVSANRVHIGADLAVV